MYDNVEEKDRTKQGIGICKDDIADRNNKWRGQYSGYAKGEAAYVRELLRLAYTRSGTYLSYRARFIAVKAEAVQREDKIEKHKEIADLEAYCEQQGYRIKLMRSHVIVEVKEPANNS